MPFFSFRDLDSSFYTLVSKTVTKNSFSFLLHYAHNMHFGKFRKSEDLAEYLSLEVFLISKEKLQFIFRNANETSFEMPCEDPFPCHKYRDNIILDFNMNNLEYDYDFLIKERPFSFTLSRKSTKEILFTTLNRQIVFKKNYVEISTDLPSENLFGLGERTTNFKIKSGIYTLYNKDLYGKLEDGKGQGLNRYGSHPMYLMRERSGNYHISYLRNTFPMDVIVDHEKSVIEYKIVGGVLDFTFFLGNTNPENVTKMYHEFLGGYSMPPFWSMGFHQCRWGYKNLDMIKSVLSNYEKENLPLDTIWTDIDYMEDFMPFTLDSNRFEPNEFKRLLEKYRKKYVMIIEPSMGTKWPNYKYLVKGKDMDIFIKNNEGGYILNKVWPGKCHFVDYFNPNAKAYWNDALSSQHEKISYSGIWLDMNEIAAFSPGKMDMWDNVLPCNDENKYSYIPGNKPLETATICPNAIHYNKWRHVQVHNYYPNMQAKLTYEFLEDLYPNSFPFILTRANAPGIGKYAAHWSGDNYGWFSFYKLSISEVLNFNLFGAPMTGADICGFGEDTPEILCAKWYQMGSLYPFSRSHAHLDSYRKEPYAMGSTLLETTRKSLKFRYSILKYYYSLFMLNKGRGTIFRPLFFEFYDDIQCLDNSTIDNFFMIGNSLLVVPNLNDQNSLSAIDTSAYFPQGQWFDLRDNKIVPKRSNDGQLLNIQTTLNEMPAVFLHSGKTIFTNDIDNIKNSYDLDHEYNILIALQEEGEVENSTGLIPALDNYDSKKNVLQCMESNCFINITTQFTKSNKKLQIKFTQPNLTIGEKIKIKKFQFYSRNIASLKLTNQNNFKETNLDSLITGIGIKYQIIKENENCIYVKINGEMAVSGETVINMIFE
jgi:alpha-glucosidase (family GH31 glycosyl hydrolase)